MGFVYIINIRQTKVEMEVCTNLKLDSEFAYRNFA